MIVAVAEKRSVSCCTVSVPSGDEASRVLLRGSASVVWLCSSASFSRYTVNVKPGGTEQSPGRHGDRSRPPLEQRQVVFVAGCVAAS